MPFASARITVYPRSDAQKIDPEMADNLRKRAVSDELKARTPPPVQGRSDGRKAPRFNPCRSHVWNQDFLNHMTAGEKVSSQKLTGLRIGQ